MEVGRVFREATSDYFYFILDKDKINFVSIGTILKLIIKNDVYYAIIEELKSEELENIEDLDTLKFLYETNSNNYIIYGKAIFFGKLENDNIVPKKPDIPPIPGDKIYLPNEEEINNIYTYNNDIRKIDIGYINMNNKNYLVEMNIVNLKRHLGIFGITGSGKSTTVAHIVNRLFNKNLPVLLFDVHRDYILSYDNATIITFSEKEKELIEKQAKEKNKNIEVLIGKLNFDLITKYPEEFIGLQVKQGPKILNLLKEIIKALKNDNIDINMENLVDFINNFEKNKSKIKSKIKANDNLLFSLMSRINIIRNWLLFERNINDKGGDYLNIIEILIDKIVKNEDKLNIDSIQSQGDEILLKENNNSKKSNIIIIDLYPLSIEEQKILIDITLDYIFNKYKQLKLNNNPDILYIFIEEAHRFAAKDVSSSYYISTIAREGRKFGLGLILITQIPSKISEDIISQINSFLFLKIINPGDLEFIKKTCPYLSKEYFEALTKLETGKCLAVGLSFKNPAILNIIKSVDVGGSEEDIDKKILERIESL